MLIENPMAKMRETMEPRSEVPDGTDLRRLMITFTLDGAEILAGGPETLYAWVDMQTAPVDGDIVMRRAINVDEDGYAIVKARAWFSYNWLMLWLDRLNHEKDDSDSDADPEAPESVDVEAETLDTLARYKAALEHIAAGNLSPCITFAQRILAGDDVKTAHRADVARCSRG